MEQGPAVAGAGAFPPFINRGNRQVSRTVVFGDRGNRIPLSELEIDSWPEDSLDVPTLIPSIKCSTPPQLEKQNSLLNDVKCRLETLRAEQQKKDVERSHQRKKDALEKALVDEEVQKLVTIKIREMSFSNDERSVQSRQASQGRILRMAGSSSVNGSVMRAASTPIGGTASGIGSPHNRTSYSEKVAGAKTFPSTNMRQGQVDREGCKTHIPPLLLHSPDSDIPGSEYPPDDLSEIGSQGSLGSLGSLGRIKRPPLIIIRAREINKTKIRAEVEEHLPSPKKLLEDDTFTCAALPALYRRNTNRGGIGATADNYSLSRQPSQQEFRARPAPFLKTKSRSRILHTHTDTHTHYAPANEQRADSSAIVTGIARKHLLQRSNTRSSASQRFIVPRRDEDSTIAALQSPTILESRFRGWGPAEPSSSSKHECSTNFY